MLNEKYGRPKPLVVTRGKIHDYLGMVLDYSTEGKVKIRMVDYVKKMIDEVPPEMDGSAVTPAAPYLFEVSETAAKLPEKTAEFFHYLTAKLLFLCKRARPDIQTPVAFLTSRVQAPDVDDYKKLARVLKYLRLTQDLVLTLEADLNSALIVKWWVDGSYAVHPDMRSHTGGAMTLGKGAVYGTSAKQKINTRSSTETEVVAVNDVIGQVLWTSYFLRAQGYDVEDSVIYQDNMSAMLLEKNGRASSSKKTRHIHIRYFFVQDKIQSGEVSIAHCPTEHMVADFFTKPRVEPFGSSGMPF